VEQIGNKARLVSLNGIDEHVVIYHTEKGTWAIMRLVKTKNETLFDAHINDEGGIWHSTNDALEIMEQESGVRSMTADLRVEMNKVLHEIRMGEPLSHDESLDIFGDAELN
jgi:hypothetical protein